MPCEVLFALATVALATAARAVVNDVFAFAAVVPVAQPTAAFALAAAAAAQSENEPPWSDGARHDTGCAACAATVAGAASLQVDDALLVTAQPRQRHRAE